MKIKASELHKLLSTVPCNYANGQLLQYEELLVSEHNKIFNLCIDAFWAWSGLNHDLFLLLVYQEFITLVFFYQIHFDYYVNKTYLCQKICTVWLWHIIWIKVNGWSV